MVVIRQYERSGTVTEHLSQSNNIPGAPSLPGPLLPPVQLQAALHARCDHPPNAIQEVRQLLRDNPVLLGDDCIPRGQVRDLLG